MGIALGSNFTVNTALPIDDRFTCADLTARDAIGALRRYEGMEVYVESEEKTFKLVGGITNSDWVVSGGAPLAARTITADDALTDDDNFILVDATGGNIVVTLPDPTAYDKVLYIKRIDASANTVTIEGNAAEDIDGSATLTLDAQWSGTAVGSNGTDWFQIGGGGSSSVDVQTVTGNYSVLAGDAVILGNATGGSLTVTLPNPATWRGILRIKKIDSSVNTVTIDGNGAETIDGAATYVIYDQYVSISVVSDGTNWSIL
jgi:hypothetical protein